MFHYFLKMLWYYFTIIFVLKIFNFGLALQPVTKSKPKLSWFWFKFSLSKAKLKLRTVYFTHLVQRGILLVCFGD